MVVSEFSYMHYLMNKQRSILNIEHGDLWLKLTNLHPNIYDRQCAYQSQSSHKNNSTIKVEFAFVVY